MSDPRSAYCRLTEALYVEGALERLRTPRLAQPWRNQRLALCIERSLAFHRELGCISLLLCANRNHYQAAVGAEHRTLLRADERWRFEYHTFGEYIAAGERAGADEAFASHFRTWNDYLCDRYLTVC